MIGHIREDVAAMMERDPAAQSWGEVVLCYSGQQAVWMHRVNNWLWKRGRRLTARFLSELTKSLTGVEIHPAADIGRRVTIDHGMGVVIGETAVIGHDTHLYHGVTLGGNKNEPVKRHPTVWNDVVIGANATLIGDIRVGDEARIGAGAVVTDDVPADTTVAGVPAEVVGDDNDE